MASVQTEVQPPPLDTLQQVLFSREERTRLLATAGWDGSVHIWDCMNLSSPLLRAQFRQSFPVFSIAWNGDHTHLFVGDAEGQVKVWDPAANTGYLIGVRTTPVRSLAFCPHTRTLVSGSWERSLCFWDTRQPTPSLELPTKGRIFGISLTYPVLAAIQSDRNVTLWDLRVTTSHRNDGITVKDTLFKYQVRSVSVSHDAKTLALGFIDGRIFVKKIIDSAVIRTESDYNFKCHRGIDTAYGVNAVCFNPVHATVLHSGGSDAGVNTWEITSKQRVREYKDLGAPVTALDVSGDSGVMAYAVGADWHDGDRPYPARLYLRDISSECTSRR